MFYFRIAYKYDPGITSVMPVAGGCLTRKKTKRCLAVFVDFFHFLLLLVTFFTGRKFCKLLFTRFRGKVCYFFTSCNFHKLLFIVEKD